MAVAGHDAASVCYGIARLQRVPEGIDRQPVGRQPLRIKLHMHDVVRPTDRVDVARTRDSLDLGFESIRNALQFVGAASLVRRPQR